MRHYEAVILLLPDRDEWVAKLQEEIQEEITGKGGKIHRFENVGLRQLSYPINFLQKAIYLVCNFECGQESVIYLEREWKLNENVLRHLVLRTEKEEHGESTLLAQTNELRNKKRTQNKEDEADENSKESKPS